MTEDSTHTQASGAILAGTAPDTAGPEHTARETAGPDPSAPDAPDLAEFWENRYAGTGPVWSGRPNQTLVAVAADLPAGRALDLGCGEGADAIWLARRGWEVTGIDVAPTAIARAAVAATEAGVSDGRIQWLASDLTTAFDGPLLGDGRFDLVSASFFHSPVEIPRADILRRAAGRVAPGGHLLIVSHADFPPWSSGSDRPDPAHGHHGANHGHHGSGPGHHGPDGGHGGSGHGGPDHRFLTPAEEVDSLGLPDQEWEVRIAETRSRDATGPDGQAATLEDTVVLLQRRPAPRR